MIGRIRNFYDHWAERNKGNRITADADFRCGTFLLRQAEKEMDRLEVFKNVSRPAFDEKIKRNE